MLIERRAARSGAETLAVDGRWFHSRVDPVKEAARLAADVAPGALVVLLSPGLGHLADALAPRETICVERHPELAALRPDLRALVRPDPSDVAQRVADRVESSRAPLAVLTGAHREEDGAYYEEIRAAIARAVDKSVERVVTTTAFAALWERNLRANAPLIRAASASTSARWISTLAPALRGANVILLAAGPSLHADLPTLARSKARGDAAVIAVDSALPAALNAGVEPDFVCTIDPQPVKAEPLARIGAIPLIASVLSPPEILARAERLLLFGQGHPFEAELGVPESEMLREVGGSVATAAATLAVRFRAARIALVGQDLAFADDRTHARGAAQEVQASSRLRRFSSMEHGKMRSMRKRNLRRVPSAGGGTVMTTPVLESYRVYLEELAAAHPEVAFARTSFVGAKMALPHRTLAEWLDEIRSSADKPS